MIQSDPQDVSTAFEALLEQVEAEIDFVNAVGSRSFEDRVYARDGQALVRVCVLVPSFRPRRGHSPRAAHGVPA